MKLDPKTPVVVGAGQVVRRDLSDPQSCEPIAMMVDALRLAAEDSGAGERLLRRADSVRCVPVIAWPYPNAAALVADDLGAGPRQTVQSSAIGGDGPQRLVNDTARAIATGEVDVALIAGAEAVACLRACPAPGWRRQAEDIAPTHELDERREAVNEPERNAGTALPVVMYALIESAVRAGTGQDHDSHQATIARMWSRFSHVAAGNPHAWIRRAYTADELARPSEENRLVAAPYTKLLTANIQVNLGAGLILASAQAAQDAGVPRDRWVFIHAGAQAKDEWYVSERDSLSASPAIRAIGRAVLGHSGLGIDEVAEVDLYSCFPSAVEVAAAELGLALDDPGRPLTLTGGLTFAGGPGNNYSTHAIATLVERLRSDPENYGLVTALGWYLTKHAAGIYSPRPPRARFESLDPDVAGPSRRRSLLTYSGPASLEAHTVTYGREGAPEAVIVSAITPVGDRIVFRTDDRATIEELSDADAASRPLAVDTEAGRLSGIG